MTKRFVGCAISILAYLSFILAPAYGDPPIKPFIELQSGPLTPGIEIEESPQPVHQIRLILDATLSRGTLILDGNQPVFDELGELIGGIDTPQIREADKGDRKNVVEIPCAIAFVKDGPKPWRLYRIDGPKIQTPIRIATRGNLADGGPVRIIILGPDKKAKTVVNCTRYGLVVP
jgi:hypothetical protein